MARAFTDEDKVVIREKLIKIGIDDISKYGFKRTSIDDIARRGGISKGAFYKFFNSKEVFFFEIMESIEKDIKEEAKMIIPTSKENLKEDLIENFCKFLNSVKVSEFILLMHCGDLETIYRGLPEGALEEHLAKDNREALEILKPLEAFIDMSNVDVNFISAMLRVLFITITHEEQIGRDQIDKVVRAQVEVVVNHVLKEWYLW